MKWVSTLDMWNQGTLSWEFGYQHVVEAYDNREMVSQQVAGREDAQRMIL